MAASYAYEVGKLVRAAEAAHPGKITGAALRNISARPDLALVFMRHIKLHKFSIPVKPDNWQMTREEEAAFWFGYYGR